jgi:type I site-specific restriction-modification system R (restriction) subunit
MSETTETKETVVKGAGPLIRSNRDILVKAYANQDIETILIQRAFRKSLKEMITEYEEADIKAWDQLIGSGYLNSDWAKGLERLRKQRDDAQGKKEDPADNC